jgi:hypothetical protein
MAKDKKWIQEAIKRPGAFSKKAKDRGKTTKQFVRAVQRNPKQYDSTTVKQANLADTLMTMQRKR